MNIKSFLFCFIIFWSLISCSKSILETPAVNDGLTSNPGLKSAYLNYYVATTGNDNNPGTSASPFKTIQKAANVVNPGDTVIVRDGTYTTAGDYIMEYPPSGSVGNYITIKSENKWGAVLDGRNSTPYGCSFTNASYVKFQDFEIKNFLWWAVGGSRWHYIEISGCHIHHIGQICTDSSDGISAIGTAISNDVTVTGNSIHDIGRYAPGESGCTPANTYWQNHDHGLYFGSVTNLTIDYNIFYNCKRGWAIHLFDGGGGQITGLSINNNTFYGTNPNRVGYIALVLNIITGTIANNIFYSPTTAGINISTDYNPNLSGVEIKNNMTYGGTISNTTAAGVTFSGNVNNTDPLFVNPTGYDFNLKSGSPAINKGVNVGLTTDYLKNTIVGLPDIGAIENTQGQVTAPPASTTYYNASISGTATKNSCGAGYTGSVVTYTVPASKYSSTVSQVDVDSKAAADLTANKQSYANANGTCTAIPITVYYNIQQSGTATKNDCGTGYTGSTVTYIVAAKKYSSTVSQADADNKAIADVSSGKQAYANTNGTCTAIPATVYYNIQQSGTATKNSCETGYTGSTVTYIVSASKYSSTVSQTDANNLAIADVNNNKQAYANANGICTVIITATTTRTTTKKPRWRH